ncbi:hypothetical protein BDW22DRAFT_1351052 [Trametopsis cervina]|nr:hypothetical protein BDW22DRAFT_1351052 [Trametopsis cervina]
MTDSASTSRDVESEIANVGWDDKQLKYRTDRLIKWLEENLVEHPYLFSLDDNKVSHEEDDEDETMEYPKSYYYAQIAHHVFSQDEDPNVRALYEATCDNEAWAEKVEARIKWIGAEYMKHRRRLDLVAGQGAADPVAAHEEIKHMATVLAARYATKAAKYAAKKAKYETQRVSIQTNAATRDLVSKQAHELKLIELRQEHELKVKELELEDREKQREHESSLRLIRAYEKIIESY